MQLVHKHWPKTGGVRGGRVVVPTMWVTLVAVFASTIVLAVVERIINAFLMTMWYLTVGFDEGEAKFGFAAMQLVTSTGSSGFRALTSIMNTLVSAVVGMVSWMSMAFILLLFTGAMYMAYEQYPTVARGMIVQWNNVIGPRAHAIMILPIEAASMFFGAVLPLYNTVTWISARVLYEGLLMPLVTSPDSLLRVFTSTSRMTQAVAESLTSYTVQSLRDCSSADLTQLQASRCIGDVGIRTLDLITPLTHFRDAVAIIIGWISVSICGPLAAPLDILFSPLMDINIIKAVHNIVNSILWTFVQVPIVTETRCRMFSQAEGVVMCLPDFEPAFRFLVEGLRRLGQGVDNWLDVTVLVVQEIVLPGTAPRCSDAGGDPTLDVGDEVNKLLFESNNTVLVGLTETMFANTDGYNVLYYSTAKGAVRSEVAENVWPIPIDVRMGVAAVTYGDSGEQKDDEGHGTSTSMMGCRCLCLCTLLGWLHKH